MRRIQWLILILFSIFEVLLGLACIAAALVDSFETVILPRTVKRSVRATNLVLRIFQSVYKQLGANESNARRGRLLASFAPLLVFFLIAFWAILIILGFALIATGVDMPFKELQSIGFGDRLYFSGATFFTLGYGDFVPTSPQGKAFSIFEAATGFVFLALVIGYIPTFYTAFSRREVTLLLLDSKAGSNPSAAEFLRRHAAAGCLEEMITLFKDWEVFSAQLLENYLSYPVLAFYRSQHDDQSWLESLVAVMDACAICMCMAPGDSSFERRLRFQANATFVMARHLIVDFSYVISCEPHAPKDRLPDSVLHRICMETCEAGFPISTGEAERQKLSETRKLYEPFAKGLSARLLMNLPDWHPDARVLDNWQTSAWDGQHF